MPATYIFNALIYKPDLRYIISACSQVFPQDVEFYDYDKVQTNDDPLARDFIEEQNKLDKLLIFKVYSKDGEKY